jgi:hypothetical protein
MNFNHKFLLSSAVSFFLLAPTPVFSQSFFHIGQRALGISRIACSVPSERVFMDAVPAPLSNTSVSDAAPDCAPGSNSSVDLEMRHPMPDSDSPRPLTPNVPLAPPSPGAASEPSAWVPLALAPVRQAVLAILQDQNACSEWLSKSDPRVAETFQSLTYQVELGGPQHVLRERNSLGNWIEHGPYIARTWQNSGRNATVILNGSGAFFQDRGDLYKVVWVGSLPVTTGSWRHIHIGPYDGGTVRAQAVALLHELAHVIGAIREDDSAKYGLERSNENTELVVQHCKHSIDTLAQPNHQILTTAIN